MRPSLLPAAITGTSTSPAWHGNDRAKRKRARRTITQHKHGHIVEAGRLASACSSLYTHHSTSVDEKIQLVSMQQQQQQQDSASLTGTCQSKFCRLSGQPFTGQCPSCSWLPSSVHRAGRSKKKGGNRGQAPNGVMPQQPNGYMLDAHGQQWQQAPMHMQ